MELPNFEESKFSSLHSNLFNDIEPTETEKIIKKKLKN